MQVKSSVAVDPTVLLLVLLRAVVQEVVLLVLLHLHLLRLRLGCFCFGRFSATLYQSVALFCTASA